MGSGLYKQIDVWRVAGNAVKAYRCFQSLDAKKYYVQSCDYIYETDKNQSALFSQKVELFLEEDVAKRCEGFSTLEEAISQFDVDFAGA